MCLTRVDFLKKINVFINDQEAELKHNNAFVLLSLKAESIKNTGKDM